MNYSQSIVIGNNSSSSSVSSVFSLMIFIEKKVIVKINNTVGKMQSFRSFVPTTLGIGGGFF